MPDSGQLQSRTGSSFAIAAPARTRFLRAATLALLVVVPWVVPLAASADAGPVYASPDGIGTSCSSSAPCDLNTAVNAAPPGGGVLLLSGDYPDTKLWDRT